jgi:hypothetical protein
MTLSVVLTPTTHQSNPSHSAAHNELHHAHNTFWGGDYSLRRLTLFNIDSAEAPGGFTPGRRIDARDGTTGAPVTADVASYTFTRHSAVSGLNSIQGVALIGAHFGNNDTYQASATGVGGYGAQAGSGDAVGVAGAALVTSGSVVSAGQVGYGGFFSATQFLAGHRTTGINPVLEILDDQPYNASTFLPNHVGVFVQLALSPFGTTGHAYRAGAAVNVYANPVASVIWDKGFVTGQGVKSAAFADYTAALRGVDLRGLGYDVGVDLTNATINASGSQIGLQGGVASAPTVASGSGAITTVTCAARYVLLGKLLFYSAVVTQTDAGTAGGLASFPLPLSKTAKYGCALAGTDSGSSKALSVQVAASSGTVNIALADGTSAFSTGHTLYVNGLIEVN